MDSAITYEVIEQSAERATAFAVLIKTASQAAIEAIALPWNTFQLSRILRPLVKSLTPDFIDRLTDERAAELKPRLQELHSMLRQIFPRLQAHAGKESIRESTEELRDVIEALVLRDNTDFKNLIAECSASIGIG